MADEGSWRITGNIQLHLFVDSAAQPAVLARINPTSDLVSRTSSEALARTMLSAVRRFASDNDRIPYLPDQSGGLALTNRVEGFLPELRRYYGEQIEKAVEIRQNVIVPISIECSTNRRRLAADSKSARTFAHEPKIRAA